MAQYNVETSSFNDNNKTQFESVILSNENGVPVSTDNPISVRFGDSPNLTAFGRLRISEARLLGEYRYQYGSGASVEMNDLLVGSGTLTPDYTRNCFIARTTINSGDRVVRQTKQYHPYIPGTSNFAMISFTMNRPMENLVQSIGMFDDQNGIIFRLNGTTPEFVIRKNGVDVNVVPQSEWSNDKLDGTGPSGVTLDFSKSQIFATDYQWLGVGRVRVGFEIEGMLVRAHEFNHTNSVNEVYMYQPSLPCRWELKNDGSLEYPAELMIICAAVYSEGSETETGFTRSISTDGTPVSVSETTGRCVLAVRLKSTLVGKPNRSIARLKRWLVLSNVDTHYKIIIFNDSSKLSSPNWVNVPGYSWCEYVKNVGMNVGWETSNDYNVIEDNFAIGGQGSNSGFSVTNHTDVKTNSIYQNYQSNNSQVIAIIAYKISSNANVSASMNWLEIK